MGEGMLVNPAFVNLVMLLVGFNFGFLLAVYLWKQAQ